eukprot:jgi/Mesen1/1709/ME000138S00569
MEAGRVILHVDLDCFYAAGCIAVNYAARAKGVNRHERIAVAKQKCPELVLVHVETIGDDSGGAAQLRACGKVSLERYRQASAKVLAFMERMTPLCERASIDEAYLDVTAQVEKMMRAGADWDTELDQLLREAPPGVAQAPGPSIVALEPLITANAIDRRLVAGAKVAAELKLQVARELGYTISAGVATNKLLAKLGSAMHKPSRITVPQRAVEALMATLPLTKVRNLGGKLGQELKRMGCNTTADVQQLPQAQLVSLFGERMGVYVWRAVRGLHDEPVQARRMTESMLAAKTFEATSNQAVITRWLQLLSTELAARVAIDAHANARRPRSLQLAYTGTQPAARKGRSKVVLWPHKASQLLVCAADALATTCARHVHTPPGGGVGAHDQLIGAESAARDGEAHTAFAGGGPADKLAGVGCSHKHAASEDLAPGVGKRHASEGIGDIGQACEVEDVKRLGQELQAAAAAVLDRLPSLLPCSRLALSAHDFVPLHSPGMRAVTDFFSVAEPSEVASQAPEGSDLERHMGQQQEQVSPAQPEVSGNLCIAKPVGKSDAADGGGDTSPASARLFKRKWNINAVRMTAQSTFTP